MKRSCLAPRVLLLSFALAGCEGGNEGRPPEKQYDDVIAHLREGSLTSAYQEWLPSSYGREVDDVLAKLPQLVDQDEYETLRGALVGAGKKLAGLLSMMGGDDPVIALASRKFGEMPKVFGIDTYERFQKISLRGVLGALEEGIFRELMQLESMRQKIGNVSFELKDRKRDWARLVVRFQPPEGDAVIDEMDLIRVEGFWVPDDWVTDWPNLMAKWREQVDAALRMKAEAPEAFKKSLAAIGDAMQNPTSLLQTMPELRRHLGLGSDGG